MRDQVERTTSGRVFAQVHFEIVIARHALVLACPKLSRARPSSVLTMLGHVLASVVDGALRSCAAWRPSVIPSFAGGITNRSSTKISGPDRVIDGHERQMIVVVDLP